MCSIGIGEKHEAPYKRIGDGEATENRWVLSQAILINTFGFKDGFKIETYNEEELKGIGDHCEAPAETYLNLKEEGALSKYEAYKNKFMNNPKSSIFNKYINYIEKLGGSQLKYNIKKLRKRKNKKKLKTKKKLKIKTKKKTKRKLKRN